VPHPRRVFVFAARVGRHKAHITETVKIFWEFLLFPQLTFLPRTNACRGVFCPAHNNCKKK
jgi:hypothetical protein